MSSCWRLIPEQRPSIVEVIPVLLNHSYEIDEDDDPDLDALAPAVELKYLHTVVAPARQSVRHSGSVDAGGGPDLEATIHSLLVSDGRLWVGYGDGRLEIFD